MGSSRGSRSPVGFGVAVLAGIEVVAQPGRSPCHNPGPLRGARTPGAVSPSPGPPRWVLLNPTGCPDPGARVRSPAQPPRPNPSHGPALTPTWGSPARGSPVPWGGRPDVRPMASPRARAAQLLRMPGIPAASSHGSGAAEHPQHRAPRAGGAGRWHRAPGRTHGTGCTRARERRRVQGAGCRAGCPAPGPVATARSCHRHRRASPGVTVPVPAATRCRVWVPSRWRAAGAARGALPPPSPVLITLIGTPAKALRPSPP